MTSFMNDSGSKTLEANPVITEESNPRPPQHQERQPGREEQMQPAPQAFMEQYQAAGKLQGKVALVSGGDSGIGRAVCIGFAKEGADVAFIYLEEDEDAEKTKQCIEAEGRKACLIKGDISNKSFCEKAVQQVVSDLGNLNILVNNAAEQHIAEDLEAISEEQVRRTFDSNFFGTFFFDASRFKAFKRRR